MKMENDKENIYKYNKLWDNSFLSPEILSTNYDYELITNKIGPSIYSFPLVSSLFCEDLKEEVQNL